MIECGEVIVLIIQTLIINIGGQTKVNTMILIIYCKD